MQISVRDTRPEDLDAIFRIRHDPLVLPHQYRTSLTGTIDHWRDRLNGKVDTDNFIFRSSTIFDGDLIIGHISQAHMTSKDKPIVQCGWNLTPSYWGRGAMCIALSTLFSRFFSEEGIVHVFSDCFRGNRRCIRVMAKLGFVPNGISLHHRAIIAYSTRCIRWIKRYRLDAEMWPQIGKNTK